LVAYRTAFVTNLDIQDRRHPTRTKVAKPATDKAAVATRAAILASAREVFARAGYDGAGVREIAAGAGVTAMLVNRYFGSKERLFAEAIAATMASPIIDHLDRGKSSLIETRGDDSRGPGKDHRGWRYAA
jgi:AcrR family transcriptional regulator